MPAEIVAEIEAPELEAEAERIAEAVLRAAGCEDAELSIVLVGDERMRELNRAWRGKDRATDVLSFAQLEGDGSDLVALLGDVVISVDTLRRQAKEGGWTDGEELARLLVHGVFHLLGHDHEGPEEAATMRDAERAAVEFLADLGISCAWEDSKE